MINSKMMSAFFFFSGRVLKGVRYFPVLSTLLKKKKEKRTSFFAFLSENVMDELFNVAGRRSDLP